MVEAMFCALAKDEDLPYRAESAGTAALQERPIAPNAVAALDEVGIHSGTHTGG